LWTILPQLSWYEDLLLSSYKDIPSVNVNAKFYILFDFKQREAGYHIYHSYIGMVDNDSVTPYFNGEEHSFNRHIEPEFFSTQDASGDEEIIRTIVELAVRDSTDANVEGKF
jgi:hypothetical protein